MHRISNDPLTAIPENVTSVSLSGSRRIGLIALRAPKLAATVLLALCVIAVFGIQRIKIDDSLSQLFRSDTQEYKQYEEVTKRFPSSEYRRAGGGRRQDACWSAGRSKSSATWSPTCS